MNRVALAVLLAALATAAQAQETFVTVRPGKEAWWLRTTFNPMHTEVRGIPVARIKRDWCKATEYTRALMPQQDMEEEGWGKLMDEVGLSFSVTGNFDRSKTKQTALVGVFQTCAGQKGRFLLVIDVDTKKVRFVDATPSKTQFAVLARDKRDIVILYCLECDVGGTLRWNAKQKAFRWVQKRGRD